MLKSIATVFASATLSLACALAAGCGDDPKIELPSEGAGSTLDGGGGGDGGGASRDAMVLVASCDSAPDGTPCGEAGRRMHCIFSACVKNACGDGIPAYGEACDDNNEIDGDGCSAHCHLEVAPGCGNGVLEPGEQCDDGNKVDGDRCTADCKKAVCGDGIVSSGEECDDGNLSNGDACTAHCQLPSTLCGNGISDPGEKCDDGNKVDGDGCQGDCTLPPICGNAMLETGEECDDGNMVAGDGCESNCKLTPASGSGGTGGGTGGTGVGSGGTSGGTGGAGSGSGGTTGGGDEDSGVSDADGGTNNDCEVCRQANCTTYQGVDFVAGCFDPGTAGATSRSGFTSTVFTMAQVQACVDAMACAESSGCGRTAGAIADECYCGPFHSGFGLDECIANGPESTAPCRKQWEAATNATMPSVVAGNISDLGTPAGWAYFVLECESMFCDAPGADCTP